MVMSLENMGSDWQNCMIYKKNLATEQEILFHLLCCEFRPPLTERVNIHEYAKKIYENAITFGAYENETLVGLVAMYVDEQNIGYITNVSVLKGFLGNGIGSCLMELCFEHANQIGCSEINLEVHENNRAATTLYKKMGFIKNET
jgi:ribosomal protein S18 acetylase RimI-like enzyme